MSYLSIEMLLDAYCQGFFPMAEPQQGDIYWFEPDPRTIIPLDSFHTPKRIARIIRQGRFDIRLDTDFEGVMRGCAEAQVGREETWISEEIIALYCELHAYDFAHSLEVYQDNQLVGGLYGVAIQGLFAGESMFRRVTNASTVALVAMLHYLRTMRYVLFDVQYTTQHLLRFGAQEISKDNYRSQLAEALQHQVKLEAWHETSLNGAQLLS